LCVYIRSYCAALPRAERFALMPFLYHSTKKWRKKGNPDVPSGASLPPAVLTMNGGGFGFGKRPPSAGHVSHPADGFAGGKICRYPVGVDASATRLCGRLCGGFRLSREDKPLPYRIVRTWCVARDKIYCFLVGEAISLPFVQRFAFVAAGASSRPTGKTTFVERKGEGPMSSR